MKKEFTKISVLITTKNEEEHLRDCLDSVKWAEEIVVVDSGSTDKTVEVARRYTEKIYSRQWLGYSEQKNWGAEKCKNDWILSIDADEEVSPELREEIPKRVGKEDFVGYFIPTKDFMFGKWILHGDWYPQAHIRLYRKSRGRWVKKVHEMVEVNGKVGRLPGDICHFSHTSVSDFILKLNLYTQLEAEERFKDGEKASLTSAVIGALSMFFARYVKKKGFLDGGHGFILAVLMVFYKFSSDFKLWELWYKKNAVIHK